MIINEVAPRKNIEIQCRPTLYIGSFNRHTNSDPASLIAQQENLTSIVMWYQLPNCVLAGDFNLSRFNWANGTINSPAQYDIEVNKLGIYISNSFYLTQIVDGSARNNNILDLIFSTKPNLVNNVNITPSISDHDAMSAKISLKVAVNITKPRIA